MSQADVQALLTLPLFMAWVKEQEPTKIFEFMDNHTCSVAQYLIANGLEKVNVGGRSVNFSLTPRLAPRHNITIPESIQDVMTLMFDDPKNPSLRATRRATFGELYIQLEAAYDKETKATHP